MNPTIASSVRVHADTSPTKWIANILSVDPDLRLMRVNIKGGSGPRDLRVASSVDLGTRTTPKIFAGNLAIVERLDDLYIVTGYLIEPGQSAGMPGATSILATPSNFAVALVGSLLQASWTIVPGAVVYQLFSNTSASPTGATIVASTTNTNYANALNIGAGSELLINGDFDSGGFANWTAAQGWTISTTVHNGAYSALGDTTVAAILAANRIAVQASASYTFALWHKITAITGGTFIVRAKWYDSAGTLLRTDDVLTFNSTDANWAYSSASVTSPANTTQVEVSLVANPGASKITGYFDEMSVKGLAASVANGLMYAVRAVGSFGQASPFSTWLTAIQQTAAIGNSASVHLVVDPSGMIRSS